MLEQHHHVKSLTKHAGCHVIFLCLVFMYLVIFIFFDNGSKPKHIAIDPDQSKVLEIYSAGGMEDKKSELLTGSSNLCKGTGIKRKKLKKREGFNVFRVGKLDFFKNYKNPVFYSMEMVKIKNRSVRRPVFRCLPYFFIVGMPKSGTSDLWKALGFHNDIVIKHFKEPMWFNRRRFGTDKFSTYLSHFTDSCKIIKVSPSPCTNHPVVPYYHLITGEASVDTMFDNPHWEHYPQNQNCNEPVVLNQHFLHFLNPNMKIIVMLRDPVERLFSDYIYEAQYIAYNVSQSSFHDAVEQALTNHKDCLKYMTQRGCAYNNSLETYEARLRIGMYHIFIEDWLRVYPKEQVLVIRFEDYVNNTMLQLETIFKFLDLRPMTELESHKVLAKPIQNQRRGSSTDVVMLPETRELLTNFYQPFNEKLASLLQDTKYLWL